MPALLIRRCIGKFLALYASMNLVTEAKDIRSSCKYSTWSFPVADLISSTAANPFDGVRDATMTWAPCFASSRAQVLPIYNVFWYMVRALGRHSILLKIKNGVPRYYFQWRCKLSLSYQGYFQGQSAFSSFVATFCVFWLVSEFWQKCFYMKAPTRFSIPAKPRNLLLELEYVFPPVQRCTEADVV